MIRCMEELDAKAFIQYWGRKLRLAKDDPAEYAATLVQMSAAYYTLDVITRTFIKQPD